jgi:hypothetical protein
MKLLPGGGRRLSWNSLSNFLNHVEFAESVGGAMRILVSTNGTGGTMQVEDPAPVPSRVYRIRIE